MSATERIEQVRSTAKASSDRHVAEINEKFQGNEEKVLLLLTVEMLITEALRSLDQVERNLVIAHMVDIDKTLNGLGL